jgi:K+-transporting ATPase ATPase B chain
MIASVEGAAAEDTQRDRPPHPAGRAHRRLPLRLRDLVPLALYSGVRSSTTAVVALLVCLIPTTIGGLLSAIGIAGMDRLLRKNVIALSGRAVEAAGDVDTLLLDKTGTITLGNRMATEFLPLPGVRSRTWPTPRQLASLADETPEGRSIVVLAKERYRLPRRDGRPQRRTSCPSVAQTRMSGVRPRRPRHPQGSGGRGRPARRGRWAAKVAGGGAADRHRIGDTGGTPLAVSDGARVLGIVLSRTW